MKQKILPFSARNTDTDHASRVGAVSRRNALRLSGLVGIGALAPHLLGACAGAMKRLWIRGSVSVTPIRPTIAP